MQQAKESFHPIPMPNLPEILRLIAAAQEEHNAKTIDYNIIKAVYNKIVPGKRRSKARLI
jgi:hypothetical protein